MLTDPPTVYFIDPLLPSLICLPVMELATLLGHVGLRLPLRWQRYLRSWHIHPWPLLALLVWLILGAFLAWEPNEHLHRVWPLLFHLPGGDKFLHAVGFTGVTFLLYFTLRPPSSRQRWLVIVRTWSLGCLISIGSEVVQSWSPYREWEGMDVIYNFIGTSIGAIVAFILDTMKGVCHKNGQQHSNWNDIRAA